MWMTPRALEVDESYETYRQRMQSSGNPKNVGKTKPGNLSMQAKIWSTPTTQEIEHPDAGLTASGRRLSKDKKSSHSLNLADRVRMWPTPVADGDRAVNYKQGETSLGYAATKESDRPTGKLNPQWVEWLMGYPVGWTDLKD
jgi:hypothetical protein